MLIQTLSRAHKTTDRKGLLEVVQSNFALKKAPSYMINPLFEASSSWVLKTTKAEDCRTSLGFCSSAQSISLWYYLLFFFVVTFLLIINQNSPFCSLFLQCLALYCGPMRGALLYHLCSSLLNVWRQKSPRHYSSITAV